MSSQTTLKGEHYTMYVFPGVGPCRARGNQIWVRHHLAKSVSFVTQVTDRVHALSHAFQASAKHRRLVFVNVHAPTQQAPPEERENFFASLEDLIASQSAGVDYVIAGDFNAWLGPFASPGVGASSRDQESESGTRLRETVAEFHMDVVSTTRQDYRPTWQATSGHQHRIDYLIVSKGLAPTARDVHTHLEMDMSFATSVDHWPVSASLVVNKRYRPREAKTPKICRAKLKDPHLQLALQQRLWDQNVALRGRPHEKLQQLNLAMTELVQDIFAADGDAPRKHWISQHAWQLMQRAWTLKDALRDARWHCRSARLRACFSAWRLRSASNAPRDDERRYGLHYAQLHSARVAEARSLHQLRLAQAEKAKALVADREHQWTTLACEADQAAAAGDLRKTYSIVRRLGGFSPSTLPGTRLANGEFAVSEAQAKERRETFFAELLIGELQQDVPQPSPPPLPDPQLVRDAFAEVGNVRYRVSQLLQTIKDNKAVGPDGLPIEVWKAAGDLAADYIAEIIEDVIQTNDVPVAWRGGRLGKLFKGKGDTAECDMYRGLLVGDHTSKIFTGVLYPSVQRRVEEALPPQQCGGVACSGANRGHHVVSSFVERTAIEKRPSAILFLDLTKAFDKLVREMAFHLVAGSTTEADLAAQLEHVANLHKDTWFALSPEGKVIRTTRGSRQGCRFGALIFNIVYSVALGELRAALDKINLTFAAECEPGGPPWAHQPGAFPTHTVPVGEVTYVDDEAVLIVGEDNASLNRNVALVAEAAHTTMEKHGMQLNWKPGKSEALIMWRGKGARAAKAEAMIGERPALTVLGIPSIECSVVSEYKHLGSMQSGVASSALDIRARLRKASAVYHSLVRKVFAAQHMSVQLRLRLFQSLVLSVLFYNSELWTPSRTHIQWLHTFYLRAVRRRFPGSRCHQPGAT
ncbi:unnamed protein product [Prorocentrum cordatum]|uniref:Reverse transcriptase domain-containing protein n=1 Tax=Prorocentrum cordatum TaxID=2364126 RepID=A0ABN9Q938_9DINO|nr:unnamed protein product [Polarella glacialis]